MNIGRNLRYGYIQGQRTLIHLKNSPKATLTKGAVKAAGVAGLYVALKDAHNWGKIKAREEKMNANADAGLDYFTNTQYLNNRSHTTADIKKKMFGLELGNTIRGSWNAVCGYVKGFGSQLLSHGLTIGASVAALTLKGTKGKVAAGILAGLTGLSFFKNACSHIGHNP